MKNLVFQMKKPSIRSFLFYRNVNGLTYPDLLNSQVLPAMTQTFVKHFSNNRFMRLWLSPL